VKQKDWQRTTVGIVNGGAAQRTTAGVVGRLKEITTSVVEGRTGQRITAGVLVYKQRRRELLPYIYLTSMLEWRRNWWTVVTTRSTRAKFFATAAITSVIGWGGAQEYLLPCIAARFNVGALHAFNMGEDRAV